MEPHAREVDGHGKMLVRNEPFASIIQQALEGYASGRFGAQVEVQRFLESQPDFPKSKTGRVHSSRVKEILTQPLYAGCIEHKPWGLKMSKGRHEGLINIETYHKIQERLKGTAKLPARKDIHQDFPLRGFILCEECERPLTACWAQSKHKKSPYYMCYYKECSMKSRAIARDKVEDEFEVLLGDLTPASEFFALSKAMFRNAWDQQYAHTASILKAAKQKIITIEKQIEQLVDRIVEASMPAVIAKYEQRIDKLEAEKLILSEKLGNNDASHGRFEDLFKLSMMFLENPQKIWRYEAFEHKRTVIKLAFDDRMVYSRNNGLQTPRMSLLFSMLESFLHENCAMVDVDGTMSNQIFEELQAWEQQCKDSNIEAIFDMEGPSL